MRKKIQEGNKMKEKIRESIVDHRQKSLSHHRASYMGMEDRVTL